MQNTNFAIPKIASRPNHKEIQKQINCFMSSTIKMQVIYTSNLTNRISTQPENNPNNKIKWILLKKMKIKIAVVEANQAELKTKREIKTKVEAIRESISASLA